MYKDMAFCHLQENLEINMVKKINEYCIQNRNKCCKKTAEAAGDLIGNKTADKFTSIGKSKYKQKEKKVRQMK